MRGKTSTYPSNLDPIILLFKARNSHRKKPIIKIKIAKEAKKLSRKKNLDLKTRIINRKRGVLKMITEMLFPI